jgi:hypothetical protein
MKRQIIIEISPKKATISRKEMAIVRNDKNHKVIKTDTTLVDELQSSKYSFREKAIGNLQE